MKNLKRLFLIQCLLWTSLVGFAQQPQWYIKNTEATSGTGGISSNIINFRPSSVMVDPTSTTISQINTDNFAPDIDLKKEADNAIYDENGNLEIFIAHDAVYNSNGTYINQLVKPSLNPWPYNQTEGVNDYDLGICRVPLSCSKYYIFRYSNDNNNYRLDYYIYDVQSHSFENNVGTPYPYVSVGAPDYSYGEVPGIHINIPIISSGDVSNYNLSISKINSNNERFLFTSSDDGVFISKITSTGVTFVPNSNIPVGDDQRLFPENIDDVDYFSDGGITESEVIQLSDGTYRLAQVGGVQNPGGLKRLYVININNDGTVNTQNRYDYFSYTGDIKGVEFSPDGNYIYITRVQYPHIMYVDITSNNNPFQALDLPSGINTPAYKSKFQIGSIEMAHNGKMYFASATGMSSLENPNDPMNASTNWIDNEIVSDVDEFFPYQGTTATAFKSLWDRLIPLPNQVDGELLYTPLNDLIFYHCGNTLATGCVPEYPGFEYNWYVNDQNSNPVSWVASGPCYTPSVADYSSYTLEVTDENKCVKNYLMEFKNDLPYLSDLQDFVFCSLTGSCSRVGWNLTSENADFNDVLSTEWYYNSDLVNTGNIIDQNIDCEGTGNYTVIVNSACGSQTFSFTVTNIHQNFDGSTIANINPVTVGNQIYFESANPANPNYTYQWSVTKNGIFQGIFNGFGTSSFPVFSTDEFTVSLVVTDLQQCITYSRTIDHNVPEEQNGGEQGESGMVLNTYPNPVTNIMNVSVENTSSENCIIQVLSLDGRILVETNILRNQTEIDMSELSPGTYFIKVFNEFESATSKVIKQ